MERQIEQTEQKSFSVGQEVIVNGEVGVVGHMGDTVVEYTRFVVVDGKIPRKETIRVVEGSALDMQLDSDNTWEKEVLRGDNQYVEVYVADQKNPIVAHIGRLRVFQRPQGFSEIRKFVREAAETIYTFESKNNKAAVSRCFGIDTDLLNNRDYRVLDSAIAAYRNFILLSNTYDHDDFAGTVQARVETFASAAVTPIIFMHDFFHLLFENHLGNDRGIMTTIYARKRRRSFQRGERPYEVYDDDVLQAELYALLFGRVNAQSFFLTASSSEALRQHAEGRMRVEYEDQRVGSYMQDEAQSMLDQSEDLDYRDLEDVRAAYLSMCKYELLNILFEDERKHAQIDETVFEAAERIQSFFQSFGNQPPEYWLELTQEIFAMHPHILANKDKDPNSLNPRVLIDMCFNLLPKRFFEDAA